VSEESPRAACSRRAPQGLADRTEVTDTTWCTREFHVRDPDGTGLQFYADL
jgi:uncharacterized glyoxalase superfamily protein PhnB